MMALDRGKWSDSHQAILPLGKIDHYPEYDTALEAYQYILCMKLYVVYIQL